MIAQVKKRMSRTQSGSRQIPVSFGAYPEEIVRWKAAADKADRPLSWWIRNRLLSLDNAEQQQTAEETA